MSLVQTLVNQTKNPMIVFLPLIKISFANWNLDCVQSVMTKDLHFDVVFCDVDEVIESSVSNFYLTVAITTHATTTTPADVLTAEYRECLGEVILVTKYSLNQQAPRASERGTKSTCCPMYCRFHVHCSRTSDVMSIMYTYNLCV